MSRPQSRTLLRVSANFSSSSSSQSARVCDTIRYTCEPIYCRTFAEGTTLVRINDGRCLCPSGGEKLSAARRALTDSLIHKNRTTNRHLSILSLSLFLFPSLSSFQGYAYIFEEHANCARTAHRAMAKCLIIKKRKVFFFLKEGKKKGNKNKNKYLSDVLLCVAFLISPIHSGRERERRLRVTHIYVATHTGHLICIAKFRRDFIKTPWASEEGGERDRWRKKRERRRWKNWR